MELLKDKIREKVEAAVKTVMLRDGSAAQNLLSMTMIEYPKNTAHGDYACNVAMQLAKEIGKPPMEIAEEIVKAFPKTDWLEKPEVAAPGFINFRLSKEFLAKQAGEIVEQGNKCGQLDYGEGKMIVTDISHPNVAKPMGVHHLLSTVIGDSINRIIKAAGYKIVRDNYLGNWGTQFGKLIYAYKTWGDEQIVKKNPIAELLKLYVKFHEEAEKNPELDEKGRAEFQKLEAGDVENKKLWEWVVDLSLQEFNKMYKRLGVEFDVINGESFYEDKMPAVLEMGKKKGVFVEGEKGALIVKFKSDDWSPFLVRKADGATLYSTRDLARIKYGEKTWHPLKMIVVVDSAHNLYFQQLFETARLLKLTDAENIHVPFGRMRMKEKSMSTRKGNIVLLDELLDEAVSRARKIVEKKNPDLSTAEKDEVAEAVGIGAVRYHVLMQNRLTDIVFDWEKMLSLEGNTGPYLQYAHARGRSILRKCPNSKFQNPNNIKSLNSNNQKVEDKLHDKEVEVMRVLVKFPEMIVRAAEEYKPHLIATYLYELTTAFNSFYNEVPVLKTEDEAMRAARVRLVEAVTVTLKNGLGLLGVKAPERM